MNWYIEKIGNMTWIVEVENEYPGESYQVLLWLQLFIDTHLDLCGYMIERKAYTDSELVVAENNRDDLAKSVFEQYYPHDERVTFCGNFPDLTPCIDMGNIWYDNRPKPRVQNVISALIHIIACKTQGHKCQLRNFIKILGGYFQQYSSIIELFRTILQTSMMGNYPHTYHRPRFEQRIRIRRSFKDRRAFDDNHFFKWISQNDQFVYYATKEFYMFMVTRQWILDQFMCETTNWSEIKISIKEAMDVTRTRISIDTFLDESNFDLIHKDLKEIHQKTLPFITKLKKSEFLYKCLQEMNRYHEHELVNKKSTMVQTSEMILSQSFRKDDEIDVDAYVKLLTDMKFVVDRTTKENVIETKWLKCFGISKEGYNLIRMLYFEYECKDVADNAISRHVDKLYKTRPYDFHLIRIFFRMIQENLALKVYNLSRDYADNQLAALRSKHFILPWEPLPDDIDEFYYCSVCQKWLNPVVDPITAKTKLNVYSQGFEKALYDHASGLLYCGKQNTSISVKKLMDSGVYYKEGEIDDLAAARIIRRHKDAARCSDTSLRSIHMLGIVKKLNGKMWALCEICGSLTQWEGAKFGNLGFTCGRHNKPIQKKKNPTDNSLESMIPQTITVHRDQLECDEEEEEEVNERAGFTTDLRTLKKRKVEQVETEPRCIYCGMKIEDKGKSRLNRILNDDNQSLIYIDAWLCGSDFDKCKRLFTNGSIVRKSRIIQVIRRRFAFDGMQTHIKKPHRVIGNYHP